MKILSRRNQIVWVNYHGTRRPGATRTDLLHAWSTVRRAAKGIEQVSPTIAQVTPLVIPGATRLLLSRLHRRILIGQIRHAIRVVDPAGTKPVQVWTFAPDVPYLVGRFNEECFLYYCVDEYRAFDGFDAKAIARAENELIDRADVVVTASEPLWHAKRERRPDALLVRHGVDYAHFAAAWRSPPHCPADIAQVAKPIFGFFGLIHHWVDVALLAEVARLRPHHSFVLIGDCKIDVASLRRLPNVHRLGRRPYADLPAYCASFDAGLLLFVRNAMTRAVNPIKMYEYLAAGLPVVSTSIPEAERYRGPIALADTPQEFATACDRMVESRISSRREEISRLVAGETWESRVAYLSQEIARRGPRRIHPGAVHSPPREPTLIAEGQSYLVPLTHES